MTADVSAAHGFAVLETQAASIDTYATRETSARTSSGPVLLAVDAVGRRHLLIPIGETPLQDDRKSAGVHIQELKLLDRDVETRYVDVVCLRPHLNHFYSVIVDEILEQIPGAIHPEAIGTAVLERWRELLERPRSTVLGPTRLAGVLGEMLVLLELASRSQSPDVAWWAGPAGHIHDIALPGASVEIKTTISGEGNDVMIHGLSQLVPAAGRSLHLAHVRLAHDAGGTISLLTALDALVDAGVDRLGLVAALAQVGVDLRDEDVYRMLLFEPVGVSLYSIPPDGEDFPRLTPAALKGDLAPGVSRVQYTVDLSVAEGIRIEGDDLDAVWRGMLGI